MLSRAGGDRPRFPHAAGAIVNIVIQIICNYISWNEEFGFWIHLTRCMSEKQHTVLKQLVTDMSNELDAKMLISITEARNNGLNKTIPLQV